MSYLQVPMSEIPTCTAFNTEGTQLAVLTPKGLDLVSWTYGKKLAMSTPTVVRVLDLAKGTRYRQVSFVNEGRLALLGEDQSNETVLRLLSLNHTGAVEHDEILPLSEDTAIMSIIEAKAEEDVLIQDNGGRVLKYVVESGETSVKCNLSIRCPNTQGSKIDDQVLIPIY